MEQYSSFAFPSSGRALLDASVSALEEEEEEGEEGDAVTAGIFSDEMESSEPGFVIGVVVVVVEGTGLMMMRGMSLSKEEKVDA